MVGAAPRPRSGARADRDVEFAIQLLAAGRVDVLAATSQGNLEQRIERLTGVSAEAAFGAAWWELGFHHGRPALSDRRVRQAVAAGIDRAGLVEVIVRAEGRALQHLSPGRTLSGAFSAFGHDASRARDLLREGGFSDGPEGFSLPGGEVALSAPEESEIAGVTVRVVQAGHRRRRLRLDVRNPDATRLYAEWRREGRFDLALGERRGRPR